jgi:excisionase family DNA binding protein
VSSPDSGSNTSGPSGYAPARRLRHEPMQFFTIAQVAEQLAVATRTVRRWIQSGDLVAHRFRGAVRIAEPDLRKFVDEHRGDE